MGLEGRILFCQLLQSVGQLVLAGLGLGLDGELDDGIRELHGLEDDRMLLVAEGIAGAGVLETDGCCDITGEDLIDLLSLVGMHLKETSHSLLLVLRGVEHVGARLAGAGVDSHECKLSDERIGDDLECERAERLGVIRLSRLRVAVEIRALYRRNVQRGGHVLNDGIQALLDTLVLVCGTAHNRDSSALAGCLAQRCLHLVDGDGFLAAIEELLQKRIVQLADLLDHLIVIHLRVVLEVIRNRLDLNVRAVIVLIIVRIHLEQVDQADVGILLADRDVDHDRVLAESVADLIHAAIVIGTDHVHLVDECHTGDIVLVSLAPYVLRLGLNAALCGEHTYCTIQNAQGTLDLDGEVDVTGGIDDVDTMLQSTGLLLVVVLQRPVAGGCRGRDGDTSLLLLCHVVHGCGAVVGFTNLVVYTGIIQDALGQRGLTCIDMRHNTDVPGSVQGIFSRY